jgi:hypothetical protein
MKSSPHKIAVQRCEKDSRNGKDDEWLIIMWLMYLIFVGNGLKDC